MRAEVSLRPGDFVDVRGPSEILGTLDANGTLDSLPFMPEMVELVGRFRVLRRAEKTCLESPPGKYVIREFRKSDVFLLEGLRCREQRMMGASVNARCCGRRLGCAESKAAGQRHT